MDRTRQGDEDPVVLTHTDARGNSRMVDVGDKPITDRVAVAEGWIAVSASAMRAVVERRAGKGDVLAVAQLAGIQGAKRTSDLVPLCHPVPLSSVEVTLEIDPDAGRVRCRATTRAAWRTGVEMEALTAVSTALLTVYDMLKAVDRGMEIGGIRLLVKRGGRSGPWTRKTGRP
ncbi:MAG: cyclic pyranopterin monophosphate synthase MoaC [Deltaproteobacteria bacterium]|nr:cyclic pyranopterin monophosphate synthase MoaC [Deltaproteobacteria bacterium]